MTEQELSKRQYQFVLLILLLVIGFVIFQQIRPYYGGLLGACTLYAILRGQMKSLTEKRGFGKGFAATLILLEAIFIFLIPLTAIGFFAADTISGIKIDPEAIKNFVMQNVDYLERRFKIQIFTPENLSFIPKLGGDLVQSIASNTYSFVINAIFILFILYFMLYSNNEFETAIRELLPFTAENKNTFLHETKSIIQASALGIPLLALIQGIFAYVGYLIFGVPNPILYAVLTAFATIIPVVGTGIVFVPIAIVLLFQQKYLPGIGVLLYGFIVIGSVDNIFRLLLQKQLANIHPLITLFGVVVGIPLFGFWGVIFGPLLLSMFFLFLNMYRHDYIPGSTAAPHVTTEMKPKDFKEIRKIKIPKPVKKEEKQTSSQSGEINEKEKPSN